MPRPGLNECNGDLTPTEVVTCCGPEVEIECRNETCPNRRSGHTLRDRTHYVCAGDSGDRYSLVSVEMNLSVPDLSVMVI
jgi:hypothetical protein